MTLQRDFRVAARLGLATVVLTFTLIVIGSVVRTTGSGLACPDWPLCQGRILPPLQFNVLIEWSHRLVALLTSLMLFATVGWIFARPATRARLGGLAALAVVLLAAQVVLGALTVWKLLDPSVVSGHLAVALLLFVCLVTITLSAHQSAGDEPVLDDAPRPAGLLPGFAITTALAYGQAVLGGMVSTNHASLVCPEWPTCNGVWFPPLEGLVGLQMMHRYGAYTLTIALLAMTTRARSAPDPILRVWAQAALALTAAQVVLGVSNVFLATPVWLSAAHLATAETIIGVLVTVTFRAAMLPARAPRPAPSPGLPGAPVTS
jgi:cytochrome c oxidase assembly protein subunit 15